MTKETELPAVKVKVLPLKWRRSGWVEGFAQPDGLGVWYSIQPDKPVHGPGDPPFTCNAIWGGPGQNMRECLGLDFKSLDEAKAAAQADYERRILSALVPSTPAESRCEELVKALKDRGEEIACYQGLLDAAIDDYNNARNTALEEAAKVAYDYECSLADYGGSVDAKHFYEGGVGDASVGISKSIRSLLASPSRQPNPVASQNMQELKDKWMDIETAPKDGTRFLAAEYDNGWMIGVCQWCKTSHVPLYGFHFMEGDPEDLNIANPTHWMPLPSAPVANGGEHG